MIITSPRLNIDLNGPDKRLDHSVPEPPLICSVAQPLDNHHDHLDAPSVFTVIISREDAKRRERAVTIRDRRYMHGPMSNCAFV